MHRITEHDHQIAFGLQLVSQRFHSGEFPALLDSDAGDGLAVFANRTRRHRINVRVVMPEVGACLEGKERVLLRKIRSDDQDSFCRIHIACRSQRVVLAG